MKMYLITEHCSNAIYLGWHLYLRDNKKRQQRNANGTWGWIRWHNPRNRPHPFQNILDALGLKMRGDGTCDDDAYAEIARLHPIPRERIGGKPRGCIEIEKIGGKWKLT